MNEQAIVMVAVAVAAWLVNRTLNGMSVGKLWSRLVGFALLAMIGAVVYMAAVLALRFGEMAP